MSQNKLQLTNEKNDSFTSSTAMPFMLCLVQLFFSPDQDGHKSTNPSKLNDNFMALINLGNYQEEVDLRTFHCIRWGSL